NTNEKDSGPPGKSPSPEATSRSSANEIGVSTILGLIRCPWIHSRISVSPAQVFPSSRTVAPSPKTAGSAFASCALVAAMKLPTALGRMMSFISTLRFLECQDARACWSVAPQQHDADEAAARHGPVQRD